MLLSALLGVIGFSALDYPSCITRWVLEARMPLRHVKMQSPCAGTGKWLSITEVLFRGANIQVMAMKNDGVPTTQSKERKKNCSSVKGEQNKIR